jgi:hypothetical protein
LINVDQCFAYLKLWGGDINIQDLLEQSVAVMLIRNSFRAMKCHNASLFDITLPFEHIRHLHRTWQHPLPLSSYKTQADEKSQETSRETELFPITFLKKNLKKIQSCDSRNGGGKWQRSLAKTQAEKTSQARSQETSQETDKR